MRVYFESSDKQLHSEFLRNVARRDVLWVPSGVFLFVPKAPWIDDTDECRETSWRSVTKDWCKSSNMANMICSSVCCQVRRIEDCCQIRKSELWRTLQRDVAKGDDVIGIDCFATKMASRWRLTKPVTSQTQGSWAEWLRSLSQTFTNTSHLWCARVVDLTNDFAMLLAVTAFDQFYTNFGDEFELILNPFTFCFANSWHAS